MFTNVLPGRNLLIVARCRRCQERVLTERGAGVRSEILWYILPTTGGENVFLFPKSLDIGSETLPEWPLQFCSHRPWRPCRHRVSWIARPRSSFSLSLCLWDSFRSVVAPFSPFSLGGRSEICSSCTFSFFFFCFCFSLP
jgi:hypothetical protein